MVSGSVCELTQSLGPHTLVTAVEMVWLGLLSF